LASSQAAENQRSYGDAQVSIEDVQAQLSHITREQDALQHTVHVAQHKNRGLKCKISALEDEVDDANSRLASARKKIDKFCGKRAKLVEEKAALQKQVNRFPGCMKLAMEKVMSSIQAKSTTVFMKAKGVITEGFKRLYRHLLDHGVATTEVNGVIHEVAGVLGVTVINHVSPHSVRRANTEGAVHNHVQVAVELLQADSESTSGRAQRY
jgi:chromosome segregation ATPase